MWIVIHSKLRHSSYDLKYISFLECFKEPIYSFIYIHDQFSINSQRQNLFYYWCKLVFWTSSYILAFKSGNSCPQSKEMKYQNSLGWNKRYRLYTCISIYNIFKMRVFRVRVSYMQCIMSDNYMLLSVLYCLPLKTGVQRRGPMSHIKHLNSMSHL